MSSWLIFGASRGTGALLVQYALAHHQPVAVLVRNEEDARRLAAQNIPVTIGDACDPLAVMQACRSVEADAVVISTMGGTQDYLAHRTVVDCAERRGLQRMLLVTSLGCGDSWPTLSIRARQAFGYAVREKSLAESWLQTSSLNYCIIRPGGLLDGEASGKACLTQHQEVHGFVRRSDVVLAIAKLLSGPLTNQIYSLTEPGLSPR